MSVECKMLYDNVMCENDAPGKGNRMYVTC